MRLTRLPMAPPVVTDGEAELYMGGGGFAGLEEVIVSIPMFLEIKRRVRLDCSVRSRSLP